MGCDTGVEKGIIANCTTQPIAGLEVIAYMFNRNAMTITYDTTNPSKITSIVKAGAELAYEYKGVKNNLNAGHDRVVADDMADRFTHYIAMKGFEFDAGSVENMDGMNDICVIVEYKQKNADGDGIFVAYGISSGLYPSSDTRRAIESNAVRSIELATLGGQEEKNSQNNILNTDYATTKTMLEALLTV